MLAQYTGASIVGKNFQKISKKKSKISAKSLCVRYCLSITVQIIVQNGHFHPVPLVSFSFHLVDIKVQVQVFPTMYGIWWCGEVHRFCVKAEKVQNYS
jgi:hypothetical protein